MCLMRFRWNRTWSSNITPRTDPALADSLMMGCAGVAVSREITIDPAEIEDALWVTREEMMRVFSGEHAGILPDPGSV